MPDTEMHFLNLERYQILNDYVNGGSEEMVIMYIKWNDNIQIYFGSKKKTKATKNYNSQHNDSVVTCFCY
jgi:hypothetical protein